MWNAFVPSQNGGNCVRLKLKLQVLGCYQLFVIDSEYSSWVPAEQPELPEPVEMNFVAENISSNLVRYNITVTGFVF